MGCPDAALGLHHHNHRARFDEAGGTLECARRAAVVVPFRRLITGNPLSSRNALFVPFVAKIVITVISAALHTRRRRPRPQPQGACRPSARKS